MFEYNGEGNFGELALLYNQPRAATVQVFGWVSNRFDPKNFVKDNNDNDWQAITEGTLWKMDRQTFRKIVLKSAFQVLNLIKVSWSHYNAEIIALGKPSVEKSHKTADFFRTGGAQPHSIAFGGVFPNITEAILVDEIGTKVRIYPPKVIT